MSPCRFPPPWTIEELNDACFVVRDHDGQQLAYVYYEEEPGGAPPFLLLKIKSSPSLREPSSSDKPIVVPNRW
jgi:hypothetical protein